TQRNTEAIAELREATQRNTEAIAELREAVAELRQTVERLVQITEQHSRDITDLREATQRNTEAIAELRQTVERLVQVTEQHSQMFKEMTQRVQQNTENIEKLRQRVEELSERTQREIRDLVKSIADLRRQFGGLAMTVGYSLEDQAYKALPSLLQRDYGIQVEGRLKRQFVQDSEGRYLEVNIFGQARRDGETVTIVGEGKVQLSKNDVKEFLRRKVKRLQEIYPNIFPVLVTRMISEWDAEDYARARGVALYYSYDF
ncbi:MAG: methyl-accepting chemotaxis protein, partial [bacterium]|nr:methyl-accepting chemotaxis protein [bacterium]